MSEIKEDAYAKGLLEKITDLKRGLEYYIERTHLLENENNTYKTMYENRTDETIKLLKENDALKTLLNREENKNGEEDNSI